MELQYEKALDEHGLTIADLNDDARVGITEINNVIRAINMLQKTGKEVSEKTLQKLRTMDKWVYFEILDQVQGTDNNDEEIPHDSEEVIEEAEEEAEEENEDGEDDEDGEEEEEEEEEEQPINDARGFRIDKELETAYAGGKRQIGLEELKSVAPTAYAVIFENYEMADDNGVETSQFTLIETDDKLFTLTKK